MCRLFVGKNMCRGSEVAYHLLVEEQEDGAGHYGVCVEYGMDSVSIADITSSQSRILNLLAELVECGVTPVCLRDVVEDWLLA